MYHVGSYSLSSLKQPSTLTCLALPLLGASVMDTLAPTTVPKGLGGAIGKQNKERWQDQGGQSQSTKLTS